MPMWYQNKNWLSLYFLKTLEVWIRAAVPKVLIPQTLLHLHYGSGTKHAREWLHVKFCVLGTGAENKFIGNVY